MVALSQKALSKGLILDLAHQVSELSSSLPGLAEDAFSVIQMNRDAQPYFGEFIIALKKSLPPQQWNVIGEMLHFLNDSFRRRTSDLHNLQAWGQLN